MSPFASAICDLIRHRPPLSYHATTLQFRDARLGEAEEPEEVPKGRLDRFAAYMDERVVDTSAFETASGLLILLSALITGAQVEHPVYYADHPYAFLNVLDITIGKGTPLLL